MFVCKYNVIESESRYMNQKTLKTHSSPHQASVPTQQVNDPEAEADCISQDSSSA